LTRALERAGERFERRLLDQAAGGELQVFPKKNVFPKDSRRRRTFHDPRSVAAHAAAAEEGGAAAQVGRAGRSMEWRPLSLVAFPFLSPRAHEAPRVSLLRIRHLRERPVRAG